MTDMSNKTNTELFNRVNLKRWEQLMRFKFPNKDESILPEYFFYFFKKSVRISTTQNFFRDLPSQLITSALLLPLFRSPDFKNTIEQYINASISKESGKFKIHFVYSNLAMSLYEADENLKSDKVHFVSSKNNFYIWSFLRDNVLTLFFFPVH